jgi:hypothetical protein
MGPPKKRRKRELHLWRRCGMYKYTCSACLFEYVYSVLRTCTEHFRAGRDLWSLLEESFCETNCALRGPDPRSIFLRILFRLLAPKGMHSSPHNINHKELHTYSAYFVRCAPYCTEHQQAKVDAYHLDDPLLSAAMPPCRLGSASPVRFFLGSHQS